MLQGEFWLPRDDLDLQFVLNRNWQNSFLTHREQESIEKLSREATWIFSGMVYGFQVDWRPAGPQRAEMFSIEPLALIDEKGIAFTQASREGKFIIMNMEYHAGREEMKRHEGWLSPSITAASGRADITVRQGSTREALKRAIREALYNSLRKELYNRPGLVKARLAFARFPEVRLLKTGHISVFVNVKLIVSSIQADPWH